MCCCVVLSAKHVGQEEAPDQYMISPITKEKIPAHKVQEHMRIGECKTLLAVVVYSNNNNNNNGYLEHFAHTGPKCLHSL